MKKTPIFLLAIFCLFHSKTISAATASISFTGEKTIVADRVLPYYLSIGEFLSLTPEKYQQLTGKKLSFIQKVSLKLKQQKLKRLIKKKEPQFLSDFDATGFVLGLFVSIFGVGISYLINYKDTKKWAWIGAGIGGVFILIALLL